MCGMIELVSRMYMPIDGNLIPIQLYCECGEELDGQSETGMLTPWGSQTYIYLECERCGFRVTGRDAECIVDAMTSGII